MSATSFRLGRPRGVAAFYRKEITDVARQPWLLAVMVAGPFLVLLLFAQGYQDEARPYRTQFVGDPAGPVAQRLDAAADRLDEFVDYRGVAQDESRARKALEDGDLDAVVVLPADPLGQVLSGERATLQILHTRLDPIERTVIRFAARLAADELNAQVLASIVGEGQDRAASVPALVETAQATLGELDRAISDGDVEGADRLAAGLADDLAQLGAFATVVERLAGDAADEDELAGAARQVAELAGQARRALGPVPDALSDAPAAEARERLRDVSGALDEAAPVVAQVLDVQAEVLVRPFRSEVVLAGDGGATFTDFYAPAAVVLLLQQFGVAFAGLTFVRERQLGIDEVYRISPLGPVATVAGKYAAYLTLGSAAGAALLALVVGVTGVPFRGTVLDAAVVVVLVLAGAIGLGLLVSLLSRTDTQAVLLTMLVLLASLFFSGFFLPVDALGWPGRALAYALPATYGIELLRQTMLVGASLEGPVVAWAIVAVLVLAVAVVLGTRRRLRTA